MLHSPIAGPFLAFATACCQRAVGLRIYEKKLKVKMLVLVFAQTQNSNDPRQTLTNTKAVVRLPTCDNLQRNKPK